MAAIIASPIRGPGRAWVVPKGIRDGRPEGEGDPRCPALRPAPGARAGKRFLAQRGGARRSGGQVRIASTF